MNALAGSLGAAILLLLFVYYASKAGLSFAEKMKGTVKRLWMVDHPHHDPELPYQPSRMDPATNRPTNTREEVLYKLEEARANAERDAGEDGRDGQDAPAPDASRPVTPAYVTRSGMLTGTADTDGGVLTVESGGWCHPIVAPPDIRVTRDGKPVDLKKIRTGDRVILYTDADGQVQRITALSDETPKTPGSFDPAAVASLALPLVAKWRQRRAKRKREKAEKQSATEKVAQHRKEEAKLRQRIAKLRKEEIKKRRDATRRRAGVS